jgi:hypothetical protein
MSFYSLSIHKVRSVFKSTFIFLFIATVFGFLSTSTAYATIANTIPDTQIGPNLGSVDVMGVATAKGDFNNNGYDDLAVGSISGVGRVDIYYGSSAGMTTTPSTTIAGEAGGDVFGRAISSGDVNNDGYDDLITSDYRYSSVKGKVYIYYGSASGISGSANVTINGEVDGDAFGASITASGDYNNDGYDDLVTSSEWHDDQTGKVYIYYGSSSGISAPASVTINGDSTHYRFGEDVASAGDVNNDGYADLMVEAAEYDNYKGKVYIYNGGALGISAPASVTLTGVNSLDRFGWVLDSAGDVNNDGYDDVIIGAYGYPNGDGKGRVYIYYGSASGISAPASVTLTGENTGDEFGGYAASVGDVNNDGYDDVLISADGYPSGDYTGRSYLYYGSALGISAPASLTFDSQTDFEEFGSQVTRVDFNGDCSLDLVISGIGADDGNYDGVVYIYYGSGGTCPPPVVPAPTSSSSNSPTTGTPSAPICADAIPTGTPNLFQINVTKNAATLYFAPVNGQVSGYYIGYGYKLGSNLFGASFNTKPSGGVLSFPINYLTPNTSYSFTVRANNGCMPGLWGNTMTIKTPNGNQKLKFYKNTPVKTTRTR